VDGVQEVVTISVKRREIGVGLFDDVCLQLLLHAFSHLLTAILGLVHGSGFNLPEVFVLVVEVREDQREVHEGVNTEHCHLAGEERPAERGPILKDIFFFISGAFAPF